MTTGAAAEFTTTDYNSIIDGLLSDEMHNGSAWRVLVIGDDNFSSFAIMDALEDAGALVHGPISELNEVRGVIRHCRPDAAVIDLVGAATGALEAGSLLQSKGVPFVFAGGRTALSLPPRFAHVPVIKKPCLPSLFVHQLRRLHVTN